VKSIHVIKSNTKKTFLQIAPISTYFDTELGSYSAFAPNLTAHT